METKKGQFFTGERALFKRSGLHIVDSIFSDGESPLKECRDILVENSSFQWKYPLWHCSDVVARDCSFFSTARAGIWHSSNISLRDCLYEAPKGFRRVNGLKLDRVSLTQASETLWNCNDVEMNDVSARGDYFGMGSSNIRLNDFSLAGNYSFDGCKNIEIRRAKMLSKDAFWNCENVVVHDSYISGEYIGWYAKNVTFVNCLIESLQGFCYMENVALRNCRLINTTLAFEYSTVDADVTTEIDSVKNPLSGRIASKGIRELIFDDPEIDKNRTIFVDR